MPEVIKRRPWTPYQRLICRIEARSEHNVGGLSPAVSCRYGHHSWMMFTQWHRGSHSQQDFIVIMGMYSRQKLGWGQ